MKKIILFLLPVCINLAVVPGPASAANLTVEEVVRKVQEVYASHCCFSARFDQLTVNVSMDLKDRFQGTMHVKKPAQIALDVESPEKQKVVIQGRSYTIFFPADGTAAHGEVPPEINLEHFFGFFTNIGNMDRNFSITFPTKWVDVNERLYFLELNDKDNPASTFRIMLGVDTDRFVIRRAIIYDALGNYNRFDLTDITFPSFLPDSLFRAAPGPAETITGSTEPPIEKK